MQVFLKAGLETEMDLVLMQVIDKFRSEAFIGRFCHGKANSHSQVFQHFILLGGGGLEFRIGCDKEESDLMQYANHAGFLISNLSWFSYIQLSI